MHLRRPWPAWMVAVTLSALAATIAPAQELEPRAYSPSPTGTNFVVGSYMLTTGDVVFDPSLPFKDVTAEVNSAVVAYGRTLGLWVARPAWRSRCRTPGAPCRARSPRRTGASSARVWPTCGPG